MVFLGQNGDGLGSILLLLAVFAVAALYWLFKASSREFDKKVAEYKRAEVDKVIEKAHEEVRKQHESRPKL